MEAFDVPWRIPKRMAVNRVGQAFKQKPKLDSLIAPYGRNVEDKTRVVRPGMLLSWRVINSCPRHQLRPSLEVELRRTCRCLANMTCDRFWCAW